LVGDPHFARKDGKRIARKQARGLKGAFNRSRVLVKKTPHHSAVHLLWGGGLIWKKRRGGGQKGRRCLSDEEEGDFSAAHGGRGRLCRSWERLTQGRRSRYLQNGECDHARPIASFLKKRGNSGSVQTKRSRSHPGGGGKVYARRERDKRIRRWKKHWSVALLGGGLPREGATLGWKRKGGERELRIGDIGEGLGVPLDPEKFREKHRK